jgi:hypothetical protein
MSKLTKLVSYDSLDHYSEQIMSHWIPPTLVAWETTEDPGDMVVALPLLKHLTIKFSTTSVVSDIVTLGMTLLHSLNIKFFENTQHFELDLSHLSCLRNLTSLSVDIEEFNEPVEAITSITTLRLDISNDDGDKHIRAIGMCSGLRYLHVDTDDLRYFENLVVHIATETTCPDLACIDIIIDINFEGFMCKLMQNSHVLFGGCSSMGLHTTVELYIYAYDDSYESKSLICSCRLMRQRLLIKPSHHHQVVTAYI